MDTYSAEGPPALWGDSVAMPSSLPVASCDHPHAAEVFFVGDLWDEKTPYAELDVVRGDAGMRCESGLEAYTGGPPADSRLVLGYTFWVPTAESWAEGDRQVGCIAYRPDGQALVGSFMGAAR